MFFAQWHALSFWIGLALSALIILPVLVIAAMYRGRFMKDQLTITLADNRLKTQTVDDLKEQLNESIQERHQLNQSIADWRQKYFILEAEVKKERLLMAEQHKHFLAQQQNLSETFKSLSFDALKENNQTFLDLAKTTLGQFQEQAKTDLVTKHHELTHLVTPMKEALLTVDKKIHELEKERLSAYHILRQQVQELVKTQQGLKDETTQLVQALRTPNVRGRWGEMQLKRVVEVSGMLAYCDFFEQVQRMDDEQKMRPDMIIRLPGGKQIIVDAKAPLHAYLEGFSSSDETARQSKMKDHARHVRGHIAALSKKSYWEQFSPTPDFVILFLPGEMFFSAALEQDPSLIETGVKEKVIIATPTTLIAMLRAIAYGWRQETLTTSAKQIGELGRELYVRLSDMGGHFRKLGRHLGQTVESFNQSVGSMEKRVMVTARKLNAIDSLANVEAIDPLKPVEITPRPITNI